MRALNVLSLSLAVVAWVGSVVVFVACGASQLPPPARALCYAAADFAAQARVDAECSIGDAGVPFAECPAAESIVAELKAAQESCK
jgi:hypothetical protein